jgi:hypothetical protein
MSNDEETLREAAVALAKLEPQITSSAIARRFIEALEGPKHERGLLAPQAISAIHREAADLVKVFNAVLLETSIKKVFAANRQDNLPEDYLR